MPYGDRTGPDGMGPGTGRRMGYCAGYDRPGSMNTYRRQGFGMHRGYGRGIRYSQLPGMGMRRGHVGNWYPPMQPDVFENTADETEMLDRDIASLKAQLRDLEAYRENLSGKVPVEEPKE